MIGLAVIILIGVLAIIIGMFFLDSTLNKILSELEKIKNFNKGK